MTTSRTPSIDDLLKRGLAHRAAGESGDLLELIVRAAEASPQRPTPAWQMLAGSRRLVAIAVIAMLLAALAAAAAIAFRPPRPLPAFVPHANGEIVTQGEGCALIALDPSTGEQRPIFAGVPACYPPVSNYELAWDPTGSRLAFVYSFFCGGCGSEEARAAIAAQVGNGLWVFDPASSQVRQLVQCPSNCLLIEPWWSADGSQITYVGPDHQVWAIPSGGGAATLVSDSWPAGVDGPAAWSPDSRTVAYADDGRSGPRVVVAALRGGGRSTLFETSGETIDGIAWSPDGRSVLVTTGADVGGAIRIVHADGSGSRLVLSLSDGPGPGNAHWSPDGSRIAFERIVEAQDLLGLDILAVAEVWTMAADGGDRRLLFEASSRASAMSDLAWSPDGRYLIFSVTEPNGSTAEYGPYVSSGIYVAADDGSGVRRLRYAPWGSFGSASFAWRPVP